MKKYGSLIIWIAALELIGSAFGNLNNGSITTWYAGLVRSPLTPPGYLFGIAWTILYAMIAISGWMIWQARETNNTTSIKKLYIAQLILNWSWTPLFFYYQLTGVALICMSMIIVLVTALIVKSYKSLKVASILLIPYLLWLLFASHLNFYIWMFN